MTSKEDKVRKPFSTKVLQRVIEYPLNPEMPREVTYTIVPNDNKDDSELNLPTGTGEFTTIELARELLYRLEHEE